MKRALGILMVALGAFASTPAFSAGGNTDSGIGEIRKIDAPARRVILRHGDWAQGNMAAMTMAMQARPGVALNALQRGDRVRFEVAREGSDWVLTKLEPLPN